MANAVSLSFESTTFDVVTRDNQPWLRVQQIAVALGYSRPDVLQQLHASNAAEFTDSMTALVKLPTAGGEQMVRVFSLRGAHLLGMFARTDKAAAFRKWVLDILDAHTAQLNHSATDTLLPSEQQTLSELVHKRVAGVDAALQGKALAEIWSRLHHKFRVAKYSQLARTQLADAIAYVCAMEVRSLPTAKPQAEGERLSANDWRNLKSVVWHASRGFRYESAWTQAVWFYLRRALGVPAPQQYCVDHLPRLAAELQSVLAATEQVHLMMIRIEKEAARRIFRSGECAEAVVAEIERQAAAQMNEYHQHKLPSYMAKDIAAITQRAPSHYDHGGDETPIAFA